MEKQIEDNFIKLNKEYNKIHFQAKETEETIEKMNTELQSLFEKILGETNAIFS